jgi:hypothetical protein
MGLRDGIKLMRKDNEKVNFPIKYGLATRRQQKIGTNQPLICTNASHFQTEAIYKKESN